MNARESNGAVQTDFESVYDKLVNRALEGCECTDEEMDDSVDGGCAGHCDPALIERAAREIDLLNKTIIELRMIAHRIAKATDVKRKKLRHDVERIAGKVGLQTSLLRTHRPRSFDGRENISPDPTKPPE